MNWLFLFPVLLPVAVIVFALFLGEKTWERIVVVVIYILLTVLFYAIPNIGTKIIITLFEMVLFLILLVYFRNRQII